MACATKQRIAPAQRSRAKKPNICLQNFTHSGVVFGGVNAFFPSRARASAAFASVKPCKLQEYLFQIISLPVNLPSLDLIHIVEKVHLIRRNDHPKQYFCYHDNNGPHVLEGKNE